MPPSRFVIFFVEYKKTACVSKIIEKLTVIFLIYAVANPQLKII